MNSNDADYRGESFGTLAAKGSIGSSTNSGIGWQLDLEYQTSSFFNDTDDLSESYGGTARLNYDISGIKLGAFAGYGYGAFTTHTRSAVNSWYGFEAAKSFGNFAATAQIGLANSVNTHASLSYIDKLFGGVEARYFLGETGMITASYVNGNGDIHSYNMNVAGMDLSATTQLGQSNLYGTIGYQNTQINLTSSANVLVGGGTEERVYAGISKLFGGSLRDVYAGDTPMMGNELQSISGALTALYDD